MENIKIKKIIRKIFNLDYSKIPLKDNDELIITNTGFSEFSQYFQKFDTKEGIMVVPSGYKNGLFYSKNDGGELYASPRFSPSLVQFSLQFSGLKKGFFYRITVEARDAGNYVLVTNNRNITIADNENNLVLDKDLTGYDTNQNCVGFFHTTSTEASLYFTIGKIVIKDIIVEEVILLEEDNLVHGEENVSEVIPENKETIAAYAVFNLKPNISLSYSGKYKVLNKLYGKGLSLVYDTDNKLYILERSNIENVLSESFSNIPYKIELNFDKVQNREIFDYYDIIDVSNQISPSTLKQGYLSFALIKNKQRIAYSGDNGKLYITIYKIQ